MRQLLAAAVLAALAPALALAADAPGKGGKAPDPVARGRHLVAILACNHCHTPLKMGPKGPEPDVTKFLSGHPEGLKMPPPPAMGNGPWLWAGAATNTAFAGPWGVTYAPNLTPDQNTGMGIWTEANFVNAIQTGKHFGVSRPIQPPMPWDAYSAATDEELKAIYAYLRTIPPIRNLVPDYQPPAQASPAAPPAK